MLIRTGFISEQDQAAVRCRISGWSEPCSGRVPGGGGELFSRDRLPCARLNESQIWVAAVDPNLTPNGLISPGLGDTVSPNRAVA